MFALVGHRNEGKPIILVKHKPEYDEELREKYMDITPGYYLQNTLEFCVFGRKHSRNSAETNVG